MAEVIRNKHTRKRATRIKIRTTRDVVFRQRFPEKYMQNTGSGRDVLRNVLFNRFRIDSQNATILKVLLKDLFGLSSFCQCVWLGL